MKKAMDIRRRAGTQYTAQNNLKELSKYPFLKKEINHLFYLLFLDEEAVTAETMQPQQK